MPVANTDAITVTGRSGESRCFFRYLLRSSTIPAPDFSVNWLMTADVHRMTYYYILLNRNNGQ